MSYSISNARTLPRLLAAEILPSYRKSLYPRNCASDAAGVTWRELCSIGICRTKWQFPYDVYKESWAAKNTLDIWRIEQAKACIFAPSWSACAMSQDFRERGRWLARNVLPHEALIRAKLRDMCVYDLDVEDVIQEMYAKFMSLQSLETIRYPRQYAILMARGIIIDHVRHSRVVSITSTGNLESLDIPEPYAGCDERIAFQQEMQAVTAALEELPKTCREVLVLRRIEGLPQKEVARRLNISEKTVEKHMANGVRLLIRLFGRGGKARANTSIAQEMVFSKNVTDKQ